MQDTKVYAANRNTKHIQNHSVAVVLHLYYPEMWDYFRSKLSQLDTPFDLYITIPVARKNDIPQDILDNPDATVFYVPNRGRDVLPFLYVMKWLEGTSYKAILKLHTKKSPHYDKGDEWLDDMVQALVTAPTDKATAILDSQATVIGPKGYYYSLEVNFEANGAHLSSVLRKLGTTSSQLDRVMQQHRSEYGFFAGTMFWISPSLGTAMSRELHIRDFEIEKAQIDGTLAHAAERAFSILPEAKNTPIYETKDGVITEADYDSGEIPEWSDKYKA